MNPYEIIDLLNKLYGAMDFLAERFNIFKVRKQHAMWVYIV